ncbi:MAG: C-GCAxxG-C-C family protein [Planctomycetota bacterium]
MPPDPRIEQARRTAHTLYEGVETPHRSCGIALAETFGLPTAPYQAFRKGGITGEGPCGAIQAGMVVLGELLGDPDPTGAVTPALRSAAEAYQARWKAELFAGDPNPDIVCNHLTAPHGDFFGPGRKGFCTGLVATVAALVAEVALDHGIELKVRPISG